jgi:hypothetical protein
MSKDFTATIDKEWLRVYGTDTVYLQSPFAYEADIEGLGEHDVYMLDLELLTAEQRQRQIGYIAERFNLDRAEVEAELDEHGMPILADEDVTITIYF